MSLVVRIVVVKVTNAVVVFKVGVEMIVRYRGQLSAGRDGIFSPTLPEASRTFAKRGRRERRCSVR